MSSRMHDISYSSINAPNGMHLRKSHRRSCWRSCFLSLPYATITSTLFAVSGLIIASFSVEHLTGIIDRLSQDLFFQRYQGIEQMRVILLVLSGIVAVIMMINLIIGFATSSVKLDPKNIDQKQCFCSRHSATNCLIQMMMILNQIGHICALLLLILFCVSGFSLHLLKTSCTHESINSIGDSIHNGHDSTFGESLPNQINLQPYAGYIFLQTRQSEMLIFRDNRLKVLCRDFVPTLFLYNVITVVGLLLLYFGFHSYIINLAVNRIRISTYKKYTELLYLNSTEMHVFGGAGDASFDVPDRF